MYPSLNYATGKDNSRTEALGKAFLCLYVASVCATGLTFPPLTAHTNTEYSWTKNLPLQYTHCIWLFILERCIYSVFSWYILPKHLLCMRNSCWKQCQQHGGIVDLGCWDPRVSFMRHTIVACFDYGRNNLPASKHRKRTSGFKSLNSLSAMVLYVFLIGREVIWFCCGMWYFHIRRASATFYFWGWLFNVLCKKFCKTMKYG